MLQKELAEAKSNAEELQYEKEEAEKRIAELNITISSLEHDKTRSHNFDNSEFKVSTHMYKMTNMNYIFLASKKMNVPDSNKLLKISSFQKSHCFPIYHH